MIDDPLNLDGTTLGGPESTPVHPPAAASSPEPDRHISTLHQLLSNLDEVPQSETEERRQDQLARARLGVASSLFTTLRAKHPSTAAHSLRVALGCSSWALAMELGEPDIDELEIAALLHDVGKVGVPDSILMKGARLSTDERRLMDRQRIIGVEILKGCAPSRRLLEALLYSSAWYDGSKPGFQLQGDKIPITARMIAIVDAFDSMTTDHVYRKAMSRERAMAELFDHAGTQFDPRLVTEFCGYVTEDRVQLVSQVARRWLQQLDQPFGGKWQLSDIGEPKPESAEPVRDEFTPYYGKLLETMHDGVAFIDRRMQILLWNQGAERITGISRDSVNGKTFDPTMLRMRNEDGEFLTAENCPVSETLNGGAQSFRRLAISGRGDKVQLNVIFAPVYAADSSVCGVSMLMHDASSQVTLEQRVQVLREKATLDALTKVANRAEFDRVHEEMVSQHLTQGASCALIICDIDHFKRINDTFGHQAGDDVLIEFAALLQAACRSGDMVARYGGEEFCILCPECDNNNATRLAETMRAKLAEFPQAALQNQCITASFGVTELQGGDTADTMLRRADRALYQAKGRGRNRVVQLGTGLVDEEPEARKTWFSKLLQTPPELRIESQLITSVPLTIAAEKLKGFVADHEAEIVSVEENRTTLKIDGVNTTGMRRTTDRSVSFIVDLIFEEARMSVDGKSEGTIAKTMINVVIQPNRRRDRRRSDINERANQLLFSLKSYFIAQDFHSD